MKSRTCKHENSVFHGNVLWCPDCQTYDEDRPSSTLYKDHLQLQSDYDKLKESSEVQYCSMAEQINRLTSERDKLLVLLTLS